MQIGALVILPGALILVPHSVVWSVVCLYVSDSVILAFAVLNPMLVCTSCIVPAH